MIDQNLIDEARAEKMDTANRVLRALQALGKADFTQARIWTSGDKLRVYTGSRGEYYDITAPGMATRCRKNMAWSHLLGDAMRAAGVNEIF